LYLLASSLAAALLGGLFEHPAGVFSCCARRAGQQSSAVPNWFFRNLLAASSASPLGDRPVLRFHVAIHTRDDRTVRAVQSL